MWSADIRTTVLRFAMKAVVEMIFPSDLRRLVKVAGMRWDFVLGTVLVVASAWGLVASPWLIGKAVNDLQQGSTDSLASGGRWGSRLPPC